MIDAFNTLPFLTLALTTIIQLKINDEAVGYLNEATIQILCLEYPFFAPEKKYKMGDAYTMMALSFRKMISGHVQGPYGEPKFAPIKGYGSVGDERSFSFCKFG